MRVFFPLQLSYVCLKRYCASKEHRKQCEGTHLHGSYRSAFLPSMVFRSFDAYFRSLSFDHRQFTFSLNVAFYLMAFKLIRFRCAYTLFERVFHYALFLLPFFVTCLEPCLALSFFDIFIVFQRIHQTPLKWQPEQKQSMMWQNGFSTFVSSSNIWCER